MCTASVTRANTHSTARYHIYAAHWEHNEHL